MVFKSYFYGCYEDETKKLMRQRLDLKRKIRYHERYIEEITKDIKNKETEINRLLELAKSNKL